MASVAATQTITIGNVSNVASPKKEDKTKERPLVDQFDRVTHFFENKPKDCIKTIRYTVQWAINFFQNLGNYLQITRAVTALKHGTDIFVLPEFFTDFNTFRLKTIAWIKDPQATFTAVGIAFCEAVGKASEVGKWLLDVKIISVSALAASRLLLVNGLGLMIGFGNRIYSTLNELGNCNFDERALQTWKLAKYTALFSIGFFLSIASLTAFLNPVIMLTCSTVSLVASFGTHVLEHPLTPRLHEKKC